MGDTGSLVMGFVLAALSLGTSYSQVNHLGIFCPILILGVPLYDTFLVTHLRLNRGMSPFLGSRDHFALRLETYGFLREEILVMSYAASLLLTFLAYKVTTTTSMTYATGLYSVAAFIALALDTWLARIPVNRP